MSTNDAITVKVEDFFKKPAGHLNSTLPEGKFVPIQN